MSFGPAVGTLVGVAMAVTANRQDARNASLAELRDQLSDLEWQSLRSRAYKVATTQVIDDVLAEVGKLQRKELGNDERAFSRSDAAGRLHRNRAFVEYVARELRQASNGRVRMNAQEREELLKQLPIA